MQAHRIFFLAILWIVAQAALPHTFYVSHSTIYHHVQAGNMEVTIRLFTHDLERALAGDNPLALRIGDDRESPLADHLVRDYVKQHFSVIIDNLPVNLSYIGKEVEHDRLYVYFEYPPPVAFNTMIITNTLLVDAFPGQKNYLTLEMAGWKQSLVFTAQQTRQIVTR